VKRLTLMRHANAQWEDPQITDFERPLNRRGAAEAEAIARRLAELNLTPDLLITSPARRTQQTADIVTCELGLTARHVRIEELLYLARAEDILKIVQTTGPRVPHLMIIGHNPGVSDLARLLAKQTDLAELSTAGVCSLTFDVRIWPGVAPETLRGVLQESPPSRLPSLRA
jgi:phosphohistidine phosphatase